MFTLRRALVAVLLLAIVAFAWLWLTRPQRVDMTAYAPADAIVYAETDSLPAIIDAFTSTDAWRELAPTASVEAQSKWTGWLPSFISFTGLGPSDAVVLSRAQVAVIVLGFQAAEESDTTLKISPREALIFETHTSEWRVKAAVEKLVGDFARKSLKQLSAERKEVDGVPFYVWAEQSGAGRKVVAAVKGSVAVVGNDEAAVRACLDVQRGARPSLAGDEQLKEMRERVGASGALAFGYAPRGSAAKAVEVYAPAVVGGFSPDPKVQSVLATLLPQFTSQTLGALGWSTRVAGGGFEDTYYFSLEGGMSQRLREPLSPSDADVGGAASVLPPDSYQVTLYDFRNPEDAWRGLSAAVSSQVDVSIAAIITRLLQGLAEPYGVENPREFLRACGGELATARLGEESEGKVLVAAVRDASALRTQVLGRLGRGASVEHVGDAELLVSKDPEKGAAAFAGDRLLMGSENDLRRCLAARAENRTLRNAEALKVASQNFSDDAPFARTLTDDREAARTVITLLAPRGTRGAPEEALARLGYSVSQTRLAEGGVEKRTRSAFGLFGEIVTRTAPR